MSLYKRDRQNGFSLIELLIVLALLLIVVSFIVSGFTNGIRTLRREKGLAERDADIKRSLELLSLELTQAGVVPTFRLDNGSSATLNGNITTASNQVNLNSTTCVRGLYPQRPLIVKLPENSPGSEVLKIKTVDSTNCNVGITANPTTNHSSGESVSSPMFPNMFGILNPPPATIPSATLSKTISSSTSLNPVRLGFVGDILNDGNLYYVEYTYDYRVRTISGGNSTIGRLVRSITLINGATNQTSKSDPITILDNVTNVSITFFYPNTSIKIPVSVRVDITAQSSAPEAKIAGERINSTNLNQIFKPVTASLDITPRGTSAAAVIFANGGELQLRDMMPPCNGTTSEGTGYAPCSRWDNAIYSWWQPVLKNFAGKKFDNSASEALP
jgi:prepilin-type N-terminal cleavage/methylation domain-containing protein